MVKIIAGEGGEASPQAPPPPRPPLAGATAKIPGPSITRPISPSRRDRFGAVPDEIDTTPTEPGPGMANAPAAPVWSLSQDDVPDTTPREDDGIDRGTKARQKGSWWWQRTFSGGN